MLSVLMFLFTVMLNVLMLSVAMLSVDMLNVVILSVVAPEINFAQRMIIRKVF